MEHINLDEIARRPQRYWNVDGLPELFMGLLWIVWGASFLGADRIPHDSAAYRVFGLLWFPLIAFGGVAAGWITRRLKARITFPRTGYVEWKEPTRATNLTAAAIAMVTAVVVASAAVRARSDAAISNLTGPVLGVILSLGFLVVTVRQRAPHYLALAGVAAAAGIALGTLNWGWESANWLFVAVGVASAIVGSVRLRAFVRKYPRKAMEGA